MSAPILTFHEVTIRFENTAQHAPVVRKATLAIGRGETLALVGESGSGKSTMAYSAMGDMGATGRLIHGRIQVSGTDLGTLTPGQLRKLRGGQVAMVPQDPMTSLSPSVRIGQQLAEVLSLHRGVRRGPAMDAAAAEALQLVDLNDVTRIARSYPHQLSGGQQQRVLIALAMIGNPDLLILDEPTTGLDVTTEARILDLIARIQKESGTAVLLITHNLGVVRQFCQRVAVIYAGDIVETGPVGEVLANPAHPYTRALLDCIPPIDSHLTRADLPTIHGGLPDRADMPEGCLFAPRCPQVSPPCRAEIPELRPVAQGRHARCIVAPQQLVSAPPAPAIHPTPAAETNEGESDDPLLSVEGLGITYQADGGPVNAVDGVDFQCRRGEVLGIVGESGCGKTSLARCIAGLAAPSQGRIIFDQQHLAGVGRRRPPDARRRIQMVFQNPESSLNPQQTIEQCLSRPLILFDLVTPEGRRDRVVELLDSVQLGNQFLTRYPHELSGGERQRVAIARAFAAEPDLVICDEPVSSLDVSIQAGILNLLQDLQRRDQVGFIFISHDLNVVRHVSDRIAVMYRGRICEVGTPSELFAPPYHPYTEILLAATPVVQGNVLKRKIQLPVSTLEAARGTLPGCPFVDRCPHQDGLPCATEPPPDRSVHAGRHLFCHLPVDQLNAMEPVFTHAPLRDCSHD